MSKTPSQQCGHLTPDRQYINPDPAPRFHHPGQIPITDQPYLRHESEHLGSRTAVYEPPAYSTPPAPRLPSLGHIADRSLDPRYMLSSDHEHLHRPLVPLTLPLRVHPHGLVDNIPRASPATFEERSKPMLSLTHGGRNYASRRVQTFDLESQHSNSSPTLHSPIQSEKSPASYASNPPPTTPSQEPRRNPNYSMPHGFDKLLHHEPESSPPTPPRRPSSQSTQSRYHLHIRQQPIAARACGAGDRDRRPVDPPPIVQILLTNFDPASQDDLDVLQDPRFTVGCLLFPVSDSTGWVCPPDLEQHERESEREQEKESDGVARADDVFSTPLLSGKAFMSPFYVDADPDPNSAPTHPFSDELNPISPLGPPVQPQNLRNASKLNQPATFFIFTDLSIRSAGLYRLQFRLMNWGSVEDTGQSMPILAEAWSDPFRVYPAKDFPGMRDSSILAEGLKELGFVELKTRGKGKGKGRKRF